MSSSWGWILRAYDVSVDVGRHVLRPGQEEVPVREAPTALMLMWSRPTKSNRNRWPVCCQCGCTCHLKRECPQRPVKEVLNKCDWRRDCAAGGRDNASKQVVTSTPTSARNTSCLTKSDGSRPAM